MSIMKSILAGVGVTAVAAAGYYGYKWITGERSEPWSGQDSEGGLPKTGTDAPEAPSGGNSVDEVNAAIEKVLADARAKFAEREPDELQNAVAL